jgi:hypothetical protein
MNMHAFQLWQIRHNKKAVMNEQVSFTMRGRNPDGLTRYGLYDTVVAKD